MKRILEKDKPKISITKEFGLTKSSRVQGKGV
jgi:hypothetical protein